MKGGDGLVTTYFLNDIMGNVFKTKTSPGIPSNYYLGLSTTTPTMAGGNVTEPAASKGYARVQLTGLSQPSNGTITNSSDISFAESTDNWGTVTHFVIYDAATSGNLLLYEALTSPRTVEEDSVVAVKAGNLTLTLSNSSS